MINTGGLFIQIGSLLSFSTIGAGNISGNDGHDSRCQPVDKGRRPITLFDETKGQEWDAGDMGCGELVLQLRARLKDMEAGEVLRLTAHDRGAPEDLPVWCKLTGHRLIKASHPQYWIERKKG